MAVQDDRREAEQIDLFELTVPNEKTRSGVDAILELDGLALNFELKSTTKETVTTVRDFGLEHIRKWQDKHWLFGFYTASGNALKYTRYASPEHMREWIESKRQYIELDFLLSERVPGYVGMADVDALLGQRDYYSYEVARSIQKNQRSVAEYKELAEPDGTFSKSSILQLLRERCAYVIRRGSTLNNPHIPKPVLEEMPRIVEDHASRLRSLVRDYLEQR